MKAYEALNAALDTIQWMSGSTDFAEGGPAHSGWESVQATLNDIQCAAIKAQKADIARLPESCYLELSCYVISPTTGMHQKVTVGGHKGLDLREQDFAGLETAACEVLNTSTGTGDARPMTEKEVKVQQEERENDGALYEHGDEEEIEG